MERQWDPRACAGQSAGARPGSWLNVGGNQCQPSTGKSGERSRSRILLGEFASTAFERWWFSQKERALGYQVFTHWLLERKWALQSEQQIILTPILFLFEAGLRQVTSPSCGLVSLSTL